MEAPVTVFTRELPLHISGRLGRHVEHDERSRAYAVAEAPVVVFAPVDYKGTCPILDQGNLGACTGYSSTALLSYIEPGNPELPDTLDAWDALARSVYSLGTSLDNISGTYPPTDTGSTGIAVAKALQKKGFASGYKHILSPAALATALRTGPVIVGTTWYNSMFEPDINGVVHVSKTSGVAGGHEYVLDGVTESGLFRFRNSWGTAWGKAGFFYMTQKDFLGLLADEGDATQIVPVSVPAPTPTPTPSPGPVGPALDTDAVVKAYNELGKALKDAGLV